MPRITATQHYFHHSVQGAPELGYSREVGSYQEALQHRQSLARAAAAKMEQPTGGEPTVVDKNTKQAP